MPLHSHPPARALLPALALTVGMHALTFALMGEPWLAKPSRPEPPVAEPATLWLKAPPPPTPLPQVQTNPPARTPQATTPTPSAVPAPPTPPDWQPQQARPRAEPQALATQPAPPAPTAAEWAFASRYALKNGKAYRYNWGQQVRSMMGTAVEGPEQGWVRFRVEIAPDGRLARLQTLWTTSAVAEQRARQAIEAMPVWPPTPNGVPLVFERTIAFTPFGSDVPPLYKDDCLPDPVAYGNRFAWDGKSPRPSVQPAVQQQAAQPPAPQALEDCLKQLPKDSIEAEAAQDQRLLEQWASPTLDR